jgi:hypothetical protein
MRVVFENEPVKKEVNYPNALISTEFIVVEDYLSLGTTAVLVKENPTVDSAYYWLSPRTGRFWSLDDEKYSTAQEAVDAWVRTAVDENTRLSIHEFVSFSSAMKYALENSNNA